MLDYLIIKSYYLGIEPGLMDADLLGITYCAFRGL